MRPQFVLFGSSIVQYSFHQGWGATLAHLYARKADIVLRGYAGWNSRRALNVVDKVFPKNAPKQPELVIVYFGGNDSTPLHKSGNGPHVPLDEYKENMRKIAKHIKSLSENIRIIFLSTPPIDETKIQKFSDDGIHLTTKGNKIVSNAILKELKDADWKPSLYWKDMSAKFEEDSPYDPISLHVKTTNISHAPFPYAGSKL
ncbi:GDSL esterase/lipase WDL1-like isoform X2 [Cicer arietinum]|uniref:GDSL esterase/lipase CPRD49-like isoform X1 n=1 Tax=Cicer arietinum TaxID=3827 RepID=A0A1S2XRG2_CICAR|nr:GDSL esterase/lipase CPRD49-like isoform X1 [Cicer arietinum]